MLVPMFNENTLIKLYLNPANETLNISTSTELNEESTYKVYDMTGRILISDKFVINPQGIDISMLVPGAYLIHVSTSAGEATYKFLKN